MKFLCIAANFSEVTRNIVTLNVTIDYVLLTKKLMILFIYSRIMHSALFWIKSSLLTF